METIKNWIEDPNRNYFEGLNIYDAHKKSKKHDAFLKTDSPDQMRVEFLFRQILKLHHVLSAVAPSPNTNPMNIAQPVEKVRIKKPEPVIENHSDPVDLRKNKSYINRTLTLNFSDLSFEDKVLFNNDEAYFLSKKQLMIENGNIEQQMRSLHTKMKSIDPDKKFNKDRKEIMDQLIELEDQKSANWIIIDTWEEIKTDNLPANTEDAEKKAIEKIKLIEAHGNFIYRAEMTIPNMPESTVVLKKKKAAKIAEVERRKQELVNLGAPYNRKSRKK